MDAGNNTEPFQSQHPIIKYSHIVHIYRSGNIFLLKKITKRQTIFYRTVITHVVPGVTVTYNCNFLWSLQSELFTDEHDHREKILWVNFTIRSVFTKGVNRFREDRCSCIRLRSGERDIAEVKNIYMWQFW